MKIRLESKAVLSELNQTSCFLGNDQVKVFVSAAVSITDSSVWSWKPSCVYMSMRCQARGRCFVLTDAMRVLTVSDFLDQGFSGSREAVLMKRRPESAACPREKGCLFLLCSWSSLSLLPDLMIGRVEPFVRINL